MLRVSPTPATEREDQGMKIFESGDTIVEVSLVVRILSKYLVLTIMSGAAWKPQSQSQPDSTDSNSDFVSLSFCW